MPFFLNPFKTYRRSLWVALVLCLNPCTNALGDDSYFDCVIEPSEVVDVSTRAVGIVETMGVDRGDEVTKGQVLATLESSIEQANAELARARAEMTSGVKAGELTLAHGQRVRARMNKLFKQRAVPELEKDKAVLDAALAAMDLREAREAQRIAQLELAKAEQALKLRTVRSPVDGVVVERLVSRGESVDGQPLLRIASVNPLNVEVVVPVALYGTIEIGMQATVMPEAPIGGEFRATVQVVDPVIDGPSGTYGVRLELSNREHKIPGGLSCKVHFEAP